MPPEVPPRRALYARTLLIFASKTSRASGAEHIFAPKMSRSRGNCATFGPGVSQFPGDCATFESCVSQFPGDCAIFASNMSQFPGAGHSAGPKMCAAPGSADIFGAKMGASPPSFPTIEPGKSGLKATGKAQTSPRTWSLRRRPMLRRFSRGHARIFLIPSACLRDLRALRNSLLTQVFRFTAPAGLCRGGGGNANGSFFAGLRVPSASACFSDS